MEYQRNQKSFWNLIKLKLKEKKGTKQTKYEFDYGALVKSGSECENSNIPSKEAETLEIEKPFNESEIEQVYGYCQQVSYDEMVA